MSSVCAQPAGSVTAVFAAPKVRVGGSAACAAPAPAQPTTAVVIEATAAHMIRFMVLPARLLEERRDLLEQSAPGLSGAALLDEHPGDVARRADHLIPIYRDRRGRHRPGRGRV